MAAADLIEAGSVTGGGMAVPGDPDAGGPVAAGAGCRRPQALISKGHGGARCKLTVAQLRELQAVLEAGPAAWGWTEDQCGTLARIAGVIRARFTADYTLAGGGSAGQATKPGRTGPGDIVMTKSLLTLRVDDAGSFDASSAVPGHSCQTRGIR